MSLNQENLYAVISANKTAKVCDYQKVPLVIPGWSNLGLLASNVRCLLRSFHSSVHLLSDLAGPERNQVLPFAADQNVLFVLSFLFGAIGKGGAAIAMTLVAEPLSFIVQPVGPPTHSKACPLIVFPLPAVELCCRGIHNIISNSQICICISKTGQGKGCKFEYNNTVNDSSTVMVLLSLPVGRWVGRWYYNKFLLKMMLNMI